MSKKAGHFGDILGGVEEETEARRAARPVESDRPGTKRGKYYQRTMRLPAAYVDAIDAIAVAEKMTKADTERWLVGIALQAYAAGKRPGGTERVIREVDPPEVDI